MKIVCDNKYTFHFDDNSILRCDRYEEKNWREFIGDGAVLSLYQKCIDQKNELNKLRNEKNENKKRICK